MAPRQDFTNIQVAAFGPFGKYKSNPAHILASAVFETVETIEVSFDGVENWITRQSQLSQNALLVFGVSDRIEQLNLECLAKNELGSIPDVLGVIPKSTMIATDSSPTIVTPLWNHEIFDNNESNWIRSNDAGNYLCNYILYRSLLALPNRSFGFVHVPNYDPIQLPELAKSTLLLAQTVQSYLSMQ